MRKVLFLALLGCVIGLGQSFEFTDSQGRCWSCTSGSECVPCAQNAYFSPFVPIPPSYPDTCPAPDCNNPEFRPVLFPVQEDPRYFYQCVNNGDGTWSAVRLACPCNTFFDGELGSCQFIWDWVPFCRVLPSPIPEPFPCEDTTIPPVTDPTTLAPTTPEETTVAAPAPPCTPCVPCMPCMIWWMCQPCAQQCNNGCAAMG